MKMDINDGKFSITIVFNKKKLVFKFTTSNMKDLCYDMIVTLIAGKGEAPSLESQMRSLIERLPSPTKDDWKSLLETARQYSDSDSDSSVLTNHTFRAEYSFGDVITPQGTIPNSLIQIISGSCVCVRSYSDKDGSNLTRRIRDVGMDDLSGVYGFFCSDKSYYSLVANEANVNILEISRDFIQTILFAQNPQAVVRFYTLFCRTLTQRLIRHFSVVNTEANCNKNN